MMSYVNKAALLVAIASSMVSAVSAECTSGDSYFSPECSRRRNLKAKALPKVRRTEGCLEVAVLGFDYVNEQVINTINTVNGADCGSNLCFDPDGGSISTPDEATIVSNLGSYDVLIVLNESNGAPPMSTATETAVAAALESGNLKKLMVYDRYASGDVNVPGLGNSDVYRNLERYDIPLVDGVPPITGPAGTIGPGSHEGNYASHGYIRQSAGIFDDDRTEQHYAQVLSGETTTVQYCYEDKPVYYSTIPMDFYLGGFGDSFPVLPRIFTNAVCHLAASECSRCQDITIDFEEFEAGDVPEDLGYGIRVRGNPKQSRGGALIFDTADPTGEDSDLASETLGKVLILSEDRETDDPDDNLKGGYIRFFFDPAIAKIKSVTLKDFDETGSFYSGHYAGGESWGRTWIKKTRNGGEQTIEIDEDNVEMLRFFLIGSGAIDNLELVYCPA